MLSCPYFCVFSDSFRVIFIQIILYAILLAYLSYVCYFIIGWLRTPTQHLKDLIRFPKVSVIIPVRNEEKYIEALLADIHLQTYPKEYFDVIIVDDYSTDNTVEVIRRLGYSNVKVIPLHLEEETFAYKKKAITTGVNYSSAELIITTDGDCRMGPNWISSIVSYYNTHQHKLISSPVSFHQEKKWYEKIQTVEFQYLIGVGAACMKNGMPSTCNGANLAYTKELFEEIHGFEGIDDIAFGDDELLLHKIYKQYPDAIGFNKSKEAIVYTYAKQNLSDFIEQRKRWAKKNANYFDNRLLVMVSIIFLLNALLLLAFPFSFFYPEIKNYLITAALSKIIFDGFFMFITLKFVNKRKYIFYTLHVLFFYIFYIIYIGIIGNTESTYQWKGRKVI